MAAVCRKPFQLRCFPCTVWIWCAKEHKHPHLCLFLCVLIQIPLNSKFKPILGQTQCWLLEMTLAVESVQFLQKCKRSLCTYQGIFLLGTLGAIIAYLKLYIQHLDAYIFSISVNHTSLQVACLLALIQNI